MTTTAKQQAQHTPFDAQLIEEIAPGLLQHRDELLAALTGLLETIENHTTTNKSGFAANAVAWWKQQARAAIAKAEGR